MVIDWRSHRYRGGSGWLQHGLVVPLVGLTLVVVPPSTVQPIEIVVAAIDREIVVAAIEREIVVAAIDREIVVGPKGSL